MNTIHLDIDTVIGNPLFYLIKDAVEAEVTNHVNSEVTSSVSAIIWNMWYESRFIES